MKFPWQRKPESDGGEIEFPDDLAKKIEAGAGAAAKLEEVDKKLSKLDAIDTFINEFKTERDAAKKRAADEAALKNKETQDAEIEELMLTDPRKAVNLLNQDRDIALMTLRADNLKREVFENDKDFQYYTGEIKKEVDALIAGQNLKYRNDPSVLANCYHTVVGKHTSEIIEGKLKNRFASADGGSRGTSSGSAGGDGGDKETPFDSLAQKDDIVKIAKQLGFTPAQYRKMLDEEGVGYA